MATKEELDRIRANVTAWGDDTGARENPMKIRKAVRLRRSDRVASATCTNCAKPPEAGRARCAAHLARHREKAAARRAERKAAGLCVVCGRPARKRRTMCREDLAYYAARYYVRIGRLPTASSVTASGVIVSTPDGPCVTVPK